jgi:hypothetical protein
LRRGHGATPSTSSAPKALGETAAKHLYAGMMVSRASSSHTWVLDTGLNQVGKEERRGQRRANEWRLARRERMRRAARHLSWWLAWQTRPTQ